jgi:hypothetical protein
VPTIKEVFLKTFICFLLFEGTFTSAFKDNVKKVRKEWKSRFFLQINAYRWKDLDPGCPKT